METAEILISRFGRVLAAGVEPSTPHAPDAAADPSAPGSADIAMDPPGRLVLHAEVLHQLCTADGLLELLDWSRQGLGADPLACMWLGSLRWYRLITGSCPEDAPQPPARALDRQLQRLSSSGRFTVRPGSATTSLRGLRHGQMSYPNAPSQPEAGEAAALLRVVAVGLVPYIDASMRRAWARQTMALTHGHPELARKAEDLADLVHLLASREASSVLDETALAQQDQIIAGLDDDVAAILVRQLRAAAGASPSDPGGTGVDDTVEEKTENVCGAIAELAREWEEVTRAR